MSQAKATAKPTDAETTQLREQITDLKNDIATISNTLTEMGAQRRDAAVDSVRGAASDLRSKGEEVGQQAVDAVRQQPATAVGLAVGVGFLLGFISGRK